MLNKLYSEKESIIHRIDIKAKIIFTLIYVISLSLMNNYITMLISLIMLLAIILLSKIKIRTIMYFIRNILPPLISIAIMYKFILYKTNFEILKTSSILIFSTVSISCFVMTTKITEMAKAIESLIPFKKIIPAYEISLMFTISLRFLPMFIKEYKRIKKAKICRGIYIEDMNLMGKVKNILDYFLPIFLLSLERAYNLAIAMETKGYRKKNKKVKWELNNTDYIVFLLLLAYLILIVGGRR